MRIALVHYSYLPVIAGVELVMAEHARLFAQAGHEVTIVCGRGAPREPRFEWVLNPAGPPAEEPAAPAEERVVVIEEMRTDCADEQVGETLRSKLRAALTEHDLVILHNVLSLHFHPPLLAALWELVDELAPVRFVAWLHDLATANPDYAPLSLDEPPLHLLTRAHPRVRYVAVSELRRRQFLALTAQPPERCQTIPNGVDPSALLDLPVRIAELTQRHALLERDFVLLHPTRLLRRKNVELTLHVTAALNAAGHSCAALITAPPEIHHATSGEYESALREMRERLGLWNDALFLHDSGPLLDHELHALFRLADALFFPSRQEGFGIPLLEAALHRLPIFCSDIEPLNSLLPARAITFSPDAEPEEIATLIAENLHADAATIARRQTLRNFSWEAIYRNFLSPLLAELEAP